MSYLPTANVINTFGSGANANVVVTELLGYGGDFRIANSTLGAIESITIISGGYGYDDFPTANLAGSGDGTATASVTVVEGVYTYPGRYLNDDGHLSSYNFLQDRDYYQNFSYVLRVKESIKNYRKVLKDLVHPAGLKMFGEYVYQEEIGNSKQVISYTTDVVSGTIKSEGFVKTGNTININYISHGLSINDKVYLGFTDNVSLDNLANGIFIITNNSNPDYFEVKQKSNIRTLTINNAGRGYNSNSYLIFTGDGQGANASYVKNANGSIISVTLNEYGGRYTNPPTVTANGANSVAATFDITIAYANDTFGNVDVLI